MDGYGGLVDWVHKSQIPIALLLAEDVGAQVKESSS